MQRDNQDHTCNARSSEAPRVAARALVAPIVIAMAALCLASATPALAQTQAAVEYYYADWDYYFETSFPDEIAILDGGAFGGVWKRTGQTFTVWPQQLTGSSATCRFFSTSFAPKSSHFYTPFDAECASVKTNPNWQYEAVAFYMQLADAAGNCPAGTKVLYRLYNNGMGGAPNHRYTTSAVIFNQMKAAGWIFEGNGNTGAFACVPKFEAEGFWVGTTATGTALYGIVLDDASYYFIYVLRGSPTFSGFVHGTATSANRQFNSSDGRNLLAAMGVFPATIAGPYVPKASMSGSVSSGIGDDTYTLAYDASYEQPASLASIVGTYTGTLSTADAVTNTAITITNAGVLSGGAFSNCSLSGSVTPRGSVAVFDLLIATTGAACAFGGKIQHSGLVAYDPPPPARPGWPRAAAAARCAASPARRAAAPGPPRCSPA